MDIYDEELYHYGVKGMKWGVRRELGRKAKTAAYIESKTFSKSRMITKLDNKIKTNTTLGMDYKNEKLIEKRKRLDREREKMDVLRNKLIKDLSQKDIIKGRGYANSIGYDLGVIGYLAGVPVGYVGGATVAGTVGGVAGAAGGMMLPALIGTGMYVMNSERRVRKYANAYS